MHTIRGALGGGFAVSSFVLGGFAVSRGGFAVSSLVFCFRSSRREKHYWKSATAAATCREAKRSGRSASHVGRRAENEKALVIPQVRTRRAREAGGLGARRRHRERRRRPARLTCAVPCGCRRSLWRARIADPCPRPELGSKPVNKRVGCPLSCAGLGWLSGG